MTVEVIFDSPNYARVVRWIETYGSTELRKEMTRAITKAARPIVPKIKTSVLGGRSSASGQSKATFARADYALSRSKAKSREKAAAKALAGAGLRQTVARGVQINNRAKGPRAGVRVIRRTSDLPPDQKSLPRMMNAGRWRHPVFGNPNNWVTQTFTPGWFSKPVRQHRPAVQQAIQAEFEKWLDRAAEEMEKGALSREKK